MAVHLQGKYWCPKCKCVHWNDTKVGKQHSNVAMPVEQAKKEPKPHTVVTESFYCEKCGIYHKAGTKIAEAHIASKGNKTPENDKKTRPKVKEIVIGEIQQAEKERKEAQEKVAKTMKENPPTIAPNKFQTKDYRCGHFLCVPESQIFNVKMDDYMVSDLSENNPILKGSIFVEKGVYVIKKNPPDKYGNPGSVDVIRKIG